jgi:hypothetical protein
MLTLPLFIAWALVPAAAQNKTAYIMIGLSQIPSDYRSTALAVLERYKKDGYNVVFLPGVTQTQFQDAVNDPNASVIWYMGHGQEGDSGYEEGISIVGPDPYHPSQKTDLIMTDSDLTVPNNSHIQEVVFHACGQNLSSWKTKFSTATFESWSTGTNGFLIDDWELYFHTILLADYIPPSPPPISIDPRIRPNNDPHIMLADGTTAVPLAYTDWVLAGNLLASYGANRTFNIFTSGGGKPGPQWLFSGEVIGGRLIAGEFTSPFLTPSYSITIDNDYFLAAYEDRDVWSGLLAGGEANIQVNDGGLDPALAYYATGALLLGLNGAEPIPESSSVFLFVTCALVTIRRLRGC